jgi:hypothetical protein
VRLNQARTERDNLRSDLAEARAQVEYWRTLAEYRERRLVERQESPEAKTASRHDRIRLRA